MLCRALRHRRERAVCSALGYPPGADRATLARMTADEAQIMIQSIMSYEMPLFHLKSLEFALFKVRRTPPPLGPVGGVGLNCVTD